MSLYGKTDSAANVTKSGRGIAASSQAKTVVFVDNTEAALAENKARGINAPGWWSYFTYTDGEGNTRHKAEMLVTIADPDTNANETQADDAIAADVASAITIGTDVASVTGAVDPYTSATAFSITASASTGSLLFQWQRQTPTGTRWTNVTDAGVFSGSITNTLAITGAAKADWDGYKFRVKLTSTAGAEEVISATGTLTYA